MTPVNADQLRTLIKASKGQVTIVHTTSRASYERVHIPNAVNVPLSDDRFSQQVEEICGGKKHPVVVYCAGPECDVAQRAAEKLEADGFTNVFDFIGGVDEWQRIGEPLETTS